MKLVVLIVFALLQSIFAARAEHRAALLIDAEDADVEELQALGFRCERVVSSGEKQLRSTIGDFAGRTPTLGTAVVFFRGKVAQSGASGRELIPRESKPGRKGGAAAEV